ncbi:MAG: glucokinase [Rhodospirillales bacterium]|nr:glucokinase [Rhodospirillales bacterium]
MKEADGLIADIGGTHARFALTDPGQRVRHEAVLRCADFAGPLEAATAYLDKVRPATRPSRGAFAVASPVTGDVVDMTNHPWTFSVEQVRRALGLRHLDVVNDFMAVALGVPLLGEDERVAVGGGHAVAGAPIAVLGPGTGLGVSGLVPSAGGWSALATEGGHATMPACDPQEEEVIRRLRASFGHVSAERVLSGPGLSNLYMALAGIRGRTPTTAPAPDEVSRRALDRTCPVSVEALDRFFSMLGTFAGNLALTLGARGGVYVAGGIVPDMIEAFSASPFRRRFEDKGRFKPYLAPIPVYVVTHPYPAFLGLTGLVAASDE